MTPEIKAIIKRAKTCAPARCMDEGVCFILATEVERLHAMLERVQEENRAKEDIMVACVNVMMDHVDRVNQQFTPSEPGYEMPKPMWQNGE